MNPLSTLAPVSMLAGAAILWIFQRVADTAAIRARLDQIQAHLLEFWLYVDAPRAIWKSWKGLLSANARLLRLLLVPLLILFIVTLPLFIVLEALYGTALLPVGRPALVTLSSTDLSTTPELRAAEDVSVETPAVRVASEGQISWRIRLVRPVSTDLHFIAGGVEFTKNITSGDGLKFQWPRLARALLPSWRVARIEVSYPSAKLALFGYEAHWSVWFLVFSFVGAIIAHWSPVPGNGTRIR